MKLILPKLESTQHTDDLRKWMPDSFDNFLIELDHIVNSCEGPDPAPLFRGHTNHEWFLDSTIVRNSVHHLFGISNYQKLPLKIREAISFHKTLTSIVLLKFGTVCHLNKELIEREKSEGIDPWFEIMKHLQQYPEEDHFINGTFLLDWSISKEIALYFAIYEGKGEKRIISPNHGAVWIYDSVSIGNTLQIKKVGEILSLMDSEDFFNANKTFPLIFHPPKQTRQPRSINQAPVHIAQMDFRYDVAEMWAGYERHNNKRVFVKLILNEKLKPDATKYLQSKNVSEDMVYPE
jgi:hypothetical protein